MLKQRKTQADHDERLDLVHRLDQGDDGDSSALRGIPE